MAKIKKEIKIMFHNGNKSNNLINLHTQKKFTAREYTFLVT